MKPENLLFDHEQFGLAVARQEQKTRIAKVIALVVKTCTEGTTTEKVNIREYSSLIVDDLDRKAIPHRSEVYSSMCCNMGAVLRFADIPHDDFEWRGVIAGESRFGILQPQVYESSPQAYDVLRLVNTPKDVVSAPDERGVYIAQERDGEGSIMFKMVHDPRSQQGTVPEGSVAGPQLIPVLLSPEELQATITELELAAQVYGTSSAE